MRAKAYSIMHMHAMAGTAVGYWNFFATYDAIVRIVGMNQTANGRRHRGTSSTVHLLEPALLRR